jgi:hypothetical protein
MAASVHNHWAPCWRGDRLIGCSALFRTRKTRCNTCYEQLAAKVFTRFLCARAYTPATTEFGRLALSLIEAIVNSRRVAPPHRA